MYNGLTNNGLPYTGEVQAGKLLPPRPKAKKKTDNTKKSLGNDSFSSGTIKTNSNNLKPFNNGYSNKLTSEQKRFIQRMGNDITHRAYGYYMDGARDSFIVQGDDGSMAGAEVSNDMAMEGAFDDIKAEMQVELEELLASGQITSKAEMEAAVQQIVKKASTRAQKRAEQFRMDEAKTKASKLSIQKSRRANAMLSKTNVTPQDEAKQKQADKEIKVINSEEAQFGEEA